MTFLDDRDYTVLDLTTVSPVQTLTIEAKRVQIVFEVQIDHYYAPRLCFQSAIKNAAIHDWSKQVGF